MKTRFIKSLLAMVLTMLALPMMGQDYMNVYFKDGTFRKFYLKNVTEITTSKLDADGVQHADYDYQHVTTIHNKYVYSLEDVDSVTFTKIDEEKAEQNFVSAMPVVFSVIEDCETIGDVESRIDEIKNAKGVADAWSDGHQLYVAIAEDEVYSFHFSHDAKMDTTSIKSVAAQVRASMPKLERVVKQKGKQLKAVIANQLDRDESLKYEKESFFDPLIECFQECGIDAHYEPNPNVDFFYKNSENPKQLNFYDYDIIILNTHGGYGPISYRSTSDLLGIAVPVRAEGIIGHSFVTSEDILEHEWGTNWNLNYGKFKKWRDNTSYHDLTDVHINYTFIDETRDGKTVWVAHPKLTEYFFRDVALGEFKNSNSLFFNCACQSLKGDKKDESSYSFANILLDKKKLGVYAGYTESTYFSTEAGTELFFNMLRGGSIEKSQEMLPEYCKYESLDNIRNNTRFDLVHLRNYRFTVDDLLFFTKNGVYQAELKVFDNTGNIPSEFFLFPATTVKLDEEQIYKEYASNHTVTLEGFFTSHDVSINPWEHIGFIPSEVEIGFEFGTTPNLDHSFAFHDSVKKEKVNNEHGKYRIQLTISDLILDQTYYYRSYIFDGKSYNYGDTYTFTLQKPAEIPAEAKDLGLPSGTKWASYNVGATAPEEYGEYFAWGELKEKDVFNESNYQFCKNGIYANLGDDIGGTEYDVARERWGGEWMMPNKQMMQELYEYCTTKWTTQNDVYGTLFTGPNGESIFLPAAGYRKDDQQMQAGVWGDYWASTASEANTYSAYELYFKDGLINCDYVYNDNPTYRRNGHTVRPVIPGLQLTTNGPLSILMGDSETIGIRYGSGSYRYEVDKEGIVSVDITGSTITIHAFSGGDAVVTVIDDKGGKATISVAVKAIPEAKDLGLPSGTKWATFNIGANCPEDYGEYYAWGENGVKDTYSESTYEYCKNGMYTNIGKDIRGTGYDTAREKWGGEWMMPSTTQFNELISNCTSEWTTINGVKGRKFTSKINGEYIFFPAAGYIGSKLTNTGTYGYYWSGNIDPDNAEKAYTMISKNATPSMPVNPRCLGFSVRPVISGLELSATGTLSMFEGNSRTVTIRSGSGSYQPEVDQEGVVSVNITGTTITINALKIGDVVFTVTDTKGGQKANITITVRAVPKAIDLGLPSGTKWANVNVGANSPEEFGDYFAWGETESKSVYTTSTYKHYKSSSYVDIGYDIRGSEYDAAQAKWGDKWKMPSSTQINELIANCTSEWTTVNGVNGLKFISKINGDSIFLPAVGYCESGVSSSGTSGYYWACDKVTDKNNGYNLGVKSSGPSLNAYSRYYGFAVRPVIRESDDDPRMDEVIPDNIRDKFKDHMPIYSGANPPNIEGSYLIKPYTVVFCEDGNWEPGHVIESYKIKFYNQSSSDNTIDMIKYNVEDKGDYSIGTGAFISGDGTHFTAYFSAEGSSSNIRTLKSIVISGTKTDKGIEDLVYGFVMVDKGSDPDNKLMKTGVFRAFKDGDGISGPTTWEFDSNARQTNRVFNAESETNSDCCGQGDNNSLGLIGNSESVKPE